MEVCESNKYRDFLEEMKVRSCVEPSAVRAGHTEANKQVKVAEDHDSSSGTKDSKSHEQKVLQESSEEEGHTGHVSPAGPTHSWSLKIMGTARRRS